MDEIKMTKMEEYEIVKKSMDGVLAIRKDAMEKTVADLKIKLANAESENTMFNTDITLYRCLINEYENKYAEFEKGVTLVLDMFKGLAEE